MIRKLADVLEDEGGGVTVTWLLVAGVSVFTCFTIGTGINTIIAYLFTRTAILLQTPYG